MLFFLLRLSYFVVVVTASLYIDSSLLIYFFILLWLSFSWAECLQKITLLPLQSRNKICVQINLLRLYLWDYTDYVIGHKTLAVPITVVQSWQTVIIKYTILTVVIVYVQKCYHYVLFKNWSKSYDSKFDIQSPKIQSNNF